MKNKIKIVENVETTVEALINFQTIYIVRDTVWGQTWSPINDTLAFLTDSIYNEFKLARYK